LTTAASPTNLLLTLAFGGSKPPSSAALRANSNVGLVPLVALIAGAPMLLAVSVAVLAKSAERRADARRVIRLLRTTKR
jgi:hypothetical protein